MLNLLLVAAFMLPAEGPPQTAIIAGMVVPPSQQEISQPVQIILLSPRYVDLWIGEVQARLDRYWQVYQPALRNHKELFAEFSQQAHRDATVSVLSRMRKDSAGDVSDYLIQMSDDGRFEFKNVPLGEYKILAIGKVGHQDMMWQELIDVRSAVPHFIELKKRVP
jgi:hypothetical protein